MNSSEERFKNHKIHELLNNVKQKCLELRGRSDYAQISDTAQRISSVMTYLENHLKIARPELVSLSVLDGIASHLTEIFGQISAFQSNNNIAHIQAIPQHLDQILQHVALLPGYPTKKPSDELAADAQRYKDNVDALVAALAESNRKLKEQAQELTKSMEQVQEKVTQQRGQIDNQNSRLDSIVATQQDQFAKAQEARQSEYGVQLNEIRTSVSNLETEIKGKYDELVKRLEKEETQRVKVFEKQSTDILAALETKRKEASDLVHVIGNIGVTGNYQKIAIEEKKTADNLRVTSILFMMLMVAAFLWIIYSLGQDPQIHWQVVLFRIFAALIFAIPAAYTAFESERHRQVEIRNRRIELELASLGPFIEKLDDEKRKEIQAELTRKYFGHVDATVVGKLEVSPTNLLDLLAQAIKALSKKGD